MQKVFYKALSNYDTEKESFACAEYNDEPSKTIQSMAEDADINVIVRRFGITGKMPENLRVPEYGDFTEATDYQSALNVIMDADEQFMKLPGPMRARFENSPAQFMDFFHDPGNADELVTMGLRNAPPIKAAPLEVKVIADPIDK